MKRGYIRKYFRVLPRSMNNNNNNNNSSISESIYSSYLLSCVLWRYEFNVQFSSLRIKHNMNVS